MSHVHGSYPLARGIGRTGLALLINESSPPCSCPPFPPSIEVGNDKHSNGKTIDVPRLMFRFCLSGDRQGARGGGSLVFHTCGWDHLTSVDQRKRAKPICPVLTSLPPRISLEERNAVVQESRPGREETEMRPNRNETYPYCGDRLIALSETRLF